MPPTKKCAGAPGEEAPDPSTRQRRTTSGGGKAAKLSKGLFYCYFPTKRDPYIAGLAQTAKELVDKLTKVALDVAPRPRALAGVDAYLAHVESHGSGFVALMRGGIGSDPQVAEVLEGVRSGILDEFLSGAPIIAVLKARPLSRIAIRSWIGMVEAASIEWLANPELARMRARARRPGRRAVRPARARAVAERRGPLQAGLIATSAG